MARESGGHEATIGVWTATFVIIGATIMGGIALIFWNWPLFWVSVGLLVAGCIGAAFAGIMDAVSEFGPATGSDAEQPSA